ncbi:MAG: hypothetical protein LBQ75_09315 [Zoogloeaceae bacterium]|jgi:hypothetical protein|nr:hypothetical protein [Zoogloeaceae bacterium]
MTEISRNKPTGAPSGITPHMNPGGCTNPGNPPMFPTGADKMKKKALIGAAVVTAVACIAKVFFNRK